jgi:isoleucyl-tRNA synthetase
MDYKNTLNLPQTDFPMKADLVKREPERLAKWREIDLYWLIQRRRAGAEKFVLHDGPPFANGDVHIGTALNKILKDIIVKYHSLRGRNAPYVPGWDCHGLPIEFKVTQEMRKAGDTNTDPAVIRTACEAYAHKYIDIQRAQFKRLGVFGDWNNPYLTLSRYYEADELQMFADIVAKGFVYRGKKPVYWSIPARTALAEAEVEYHEHVSQSIFVKFPVAGKPGTFIVIWTTTPWTLPANLAVAYNSTFGYSEVKVGEERYFVSSLLAPAVAAKCNWAGQTVVRTVPAIELAKLQYQHPFCNRTGRLFPGDNFVENTTGSGFVHIAPGHGLDDYNLGSAHGLPIYSPVDDNGAFAWTNDLPREQQMPSKMIGKSILEKHGRSEANEVVLDELRARQALLHQEPYRHSYPYCWRSKVPVIFRAMDQWFIAIDHKHDGFREQITKAWNNTWEKWEKVFSKNPESEKLYAQFYNVILEACRKADPSITTLNPETIPPTLRLGALAAIDGSDVKWIPDWGCNRIRSSVGTRPDWCISRQRTWGVPIPAFFDSHGNDIAQGNDELRAEIVKNTAELIREHGSNIWFEKSVEELWALVKPKAKLESHVPESPTAEEANRVLLETLVPVTKSNDTLDVWIDSGSSSRSVLKHREIFQHDNKSGDEAWQADMYLEGSDQHRGWFQSSLLLSLAGNGVAPFKTVLTHGFMVDADREKISKSKQGQGVYEKPQTAEAYVKKWGADVVRLWVASQDFRNDIVVSDERVNKVSETYRAIRNTLRYQLSNLYDFDPAKNAVADDKLTGLDRWILGEFSRLEQEVIEAYDRYEFHVVYQKVSQFVAVELSAIYHDAVKDRLYTDAANSHRRRSTQTALHRLVNGLCRMLAPILAFTADEAWEYVPGRAVESAHLADWQHAAFNVDEAEQKLWHTLFELRDLVLPELEKSRQAKSIGKALDAKVLLAGSSSSLDAVRDAVAELRELLNVSQLEIKPGGEGVTVTVAKADGQKCERCWHWETDVGSVPEHPTICGRCVAAVKENQPGG